MQNMEATNNVTLKQPPNIVSTKDMLYIEDMLSWNLGAAKMARDYASKVQDQEIKQGFEAAYQMHKNHYDRLLQFLQNYSKNNA